MLGLRRLPSRPCGQLLARGNATMQSADVANPPSPPPPPAQTNRAQSPTASKATKASEAAPGDTQGTQKKRPPRYTPRRPAISLERPRRYMRPIGRGVLPVYDLAVDYIKRDSSKLKRELEEVKAELKKVSQSAAEAEALQKRVNILEIQSEINLPSVRWKARNGLADLSNPVYQHLLEQRWRTEGSLDLLMERVYQMSVVPDLMPSLHPSLDLRINYPEGPPKDIVRRTREKRRYEKVEPGLFLLPEQTRRPPQLYATVFHTEPRLYTLLMVDLDVPDPENSSFKTYLHWMQPNISLSTSTTEVVVPHSLVPYIPPHPQRGTPYHRYVVLLLPQQSPTESVSIPVPAERLGFDFRAFAQKHGLDGSKGGGAHMWREIWSPTVSHIYKETLKLEEPVFGRLQKPDPYADIKKVSKYV